MSKYRITFIAKNVTFEQEGNTPQDAVEKSVEKNFPDRLVVSLDKVEKNNPQANVLVVLIGGQRKSESHYFLTTEKATRTYTIMFTNIAGVPKQTSLEANNPRAAACQAFRQIDPTQKYTLEPTKDRTKANVSVSTTSSDGRKIDNYYILTYELKKRGVTNEDKVKAINAGKKAVQQNVALISEGQDKLLDDLEKINDSFKKAFVEKFESEYPKALESEKVRAEADKAVAKKVAGLKTPPTADKLALYNQQELAIAACKASAGGYAPSASERDELIAGNIRSVALSAYKANSIDASGVVKSLGSDTEIADTGLKKPFGSSDLLNILRDNICLIITRKTNGGLTSFVGTTNLELVSHLVGEGMIVYSMLTNAKGPLKDLVVNKTKINRFLNPVDYDRETTEDDTVPSIYVYSCHTRLKEKAGGKLESSSYQYSFKPTEVETIKVLKNMPVTHYFGTVNNALANQDVSNFADAPTLVVEGAKVTKALMGGDAALDNNAVVDIRNTYALVRDTLEKEFRVVLTRGTEEFAEQLGAERNNYIEKKLDNIMRGLDRNIQYFR